MAFIEHLHHNKPNITYLFVMRNTYILQGFLLTLLHDIIRKNQLQEHTYFQTMPIIQCNMAQYNMRQWVSLFPLGLPLIGACVHRGTGSILV